MDASRFLGHYVLVLEGEYKGRYGEMVSFADNWVMLTLDDGEDVVIEWDTDKPFSLLEKIK